MPYIDPSKNAMGGCRVHMNQIHPDAVRQIGEGTLDIQLPEVMPSLRPEFMAVGASRTPYEPVEFTILGGTEDTTAVLYDATE